MAFLTSGLVTAFHPKNAVNSWLRKCPFSSESWNPEVFSPFLISDIPLYSQKKIQRGRDSWGEPRPAGGQTPDKRLEVSSAKSNTNRECRGIQGPDSCHCPQDGQETKYSPISGVILCCSGSVTLVTHIMRHPSPQIGEPIRITPGSAYPVLEGSVEMCTGEASPNQTLFGRRFICRQTVPWGAHWTPDHYVMLLPQTEMGLLSSPFSLHL